MYNYNLEFPYRIKKVIKNIFINIKSYKGEKVMR